MRHIDLDGRVTQVLVEILEGALETDCGVLRIELVSGLAGDKRLALACMAAETPASWMGPMRTARRGDGEVHGRDFFGAQAAGESGFHRCLDALAASISSNAWQIPSSMEPLAGNRP